MPYTRILKLAGLIASALMAGCSDAPYQVVWKVKSPDGLHVATMSLRETGTLGSSYFDLTVAKADGSDGVVVFQGENADAEEPIWTKPAELIVPFCFGQISRVDSVLAIKAPTTTFRTRTSERVRVHIITSPDTHVAGRMVCSSETARP